MKLRRDSRRGGAVAVLLVVILIVGMLMQQTIRSVSILRRGQDQQTRIDQANQLLELGIDLDQQGTLPEIQPGSPWIVPMGSEFGRLEAMELPAKSGLRKMWFAKIPVDANGLDLPNQVATEVSCERL